MSVVLGKTMVWCIVLLLMCKMGEWIYMTKFWLIVPLVIMNALLLFVMIDFGRNCKEKYQKSDLVSCQQCMWLIFYT